MSNSEIRNNFAKLEGGEGWRQTTLHRHSSGRLTLVGVRRRLRSITQRFDPTLHVFRGPDLRMRNRCFLLGLRRQVEATRTNARVLPAQIQEAFAAMLT